MGIGGTSGVPADWQTLPDRFERGIEAILPIDNPLEIAMMFSLWSARDRFFFNGNNKDGENHDVRELMKNGWTPFRYRIHRERNSMKK